MKRSEVVVIGGGQAGLAMSHCLSQRAIDHVVLERGRVAERWRSARWDSLRLLTPNWMSRLPGYRYTGTQPDGYMSMPEVVDYLEGYARSFPVPLEAGVSVRAVELAESGYSVATDHGTWRAAFVVVATGHCDVPFVPEMARRLDRGVLQLVPERYRNPEQLPRGGVLVVGASASGIQLAEEIHRSGRPVSLAVGRHARTPRTYRGRDILWWLDALGSLDEAETDVYDIEVSRRQPSLQLAGRPDRATLELPLLERRGVRLLGRAVDADGSRVAFADDLVSHTAAADVKLSRLLARIDDFVAGHGLERDVEPAEPFQPFLWPAYPPDQLDLRAEGIATVLWATGYKRRYPWLSVPVLDSAGEVRHQGGITPSPGLYVLGLNFLRRRKSSFIDGVGDDARVLAEHIEAARAGRRPQAVA